jgi:hypothetical protein
MTCVRSGLPGEETRIGRVLAVSPGIPPPYKLGIDVQTVRVDAPQGAAVPVLSARDDPHSPTKHQAREVLFGPLTPRLVVFRRVELDQTHAHEAMLWREHLERLAASDRARVKRAAQSYGSERAKKFFARALAEVGAQDAA